MSRSERSQANNIQVVIKKRLLDWLHKHKD